MKKNKTVFIKRLLFIIIMTNIHLFANATNIKVEFYLINKNINYKII